MLTTTPELFSSNEEYLEWEFVRLRRRLEARIALRDDPASVAEVSAIYAALAEERPAGTTARAALSYCPFHSLAERFTLTALEEEILLACLAMHLRNPLRELLLYAQGSVLKPELEVGFLADVFGDEASGQAGRAWVDPTGRLTSAGLCVTETAPDDKQSSTLLAHRVHAPHHLAAFIVGLPPLDAKLAGCCELVEPVRRLYDIVLDDHARKRAEGFVKEFVAADGSLLDPSSRSWVVLVSGPRGSGKTSVAEGIAKTLDQPMFLAHLDRLVSATDTIHCLESILRNARFVEAVLVLSRPEVLLAAQPAVAGFVDDLIARHQGVTVLEAGDVQALSASCNPLVNTTIEIERTDSDARVQLWESLLPAELTLETGVGLRSLAMDYELSGRQIDAAIAWGVQRTAARGDGIVQTSDLEAGARMQMRSSLQDLTDSTRSRLTLADLVLPEVTMAQVQELLDACQNRNRVMNDWGFGRRLVTGRGLIALFSGEPGTGKTLTAEILAGALDLRLQMVSVPKVVSKWVGETEKNLRAIFSHARAQNAMLLFDEADSFFSTRVKVERSQDHYQNMEVNMLLQEIERFDGVVILTSNLATNMDRAMMRRILFQIEFPVPESEQRQRIWKTLLPAEAPVSDDVDFDLLGEAFELTGGQIKNAVIRAAYRCATQRLPLDAAHLEAAAYQQARDAGKLTKPLGELRKGILLRRAREVTGSRGS